jgi:ankyrin repeat protein
LNAIKFNREDIVLLLLKDKRVDPSAQNDYCIQKAVDGNKIEIVKILLADKRVDPSANGNYALKEAVRLRYYAIAKLLLKYGNSILNFSGRNRTGT